MQSIVGKDEAVDAKSIEVAPTIDEVQVIEEETKDTTDRVKDSSPAITISESEVQSVSGFTSNPPF